MNDEREEKIRNYDKMQEEFFEFQIIGGSHDGGTLRIKGKHVLQEIALSSRSKKEIEIYRLVTQSGFAFKFSHVQNVFLWEDVQPDGSIKKREG